MPIDYRLTQIAWYQTKIENDDQTILNWVDSNPGSNLSEIATGTGLDEQTTTIIIEIMKYAQLLVGANEQSGIMHHWTVEDWAALIKGNTQNARDWQATNNNGLVSAMATDLSISFPVAERLGWILEAEGTSKRTDL